MPVNLRLGAIPPKLVSFAAVLALMVVALVALSGGEAAGQGQPKCGDRITVDTTLHKDLVDCPNNGILIGADDVTLDLNGHTIDGDGTPAAGCDPEAEFCDVGVLNRGHDGMTVMHGSVHQFNVGVWGLRASRNRILGISSSSEGCCGLGFFRGTRSLVRNSSGSGSGDNGMFLIASHRVRILDNSFSRNKNNGLFVGVKGFGATHNLIKGNVLSRNQTEGIELEGSDRNQVRGNRIVREGRFGILVTPGNRNVIARNRVSQPGRTGIMVDGHAHNVIAHNSVRDAGRDGIGLGFAVRAGNVVRGNRIRGADKDGVHVGRKASPALLRRNRASHSKDDGFDVNNRGTKLTGNRALRNHDLGIEAVRGVIDGGGNVARHNGDPRQCTHIACS
jgi:parallel beta-helix repeat protein